MLSDQIQAKIERELKKYPADQRQSAVMAALRFVQDEKGWIAPEDMADIAVYIGMPQMAVFEVATFYTMYNLEPVGKYMIEVCTTTPCTDQAGQSDWARHCSGVSRSISEPMEWKQLRRAWMVSSRLVIGLAFRGIPNRGRSGTG